jgi:hypothetical protein
MSLLLLDESQSPVISGRAVELRAVNLQVAVSTLFPLKADGRDYNTARNLELSASDAIGPHLNCENGI